MSRSLLVVTFLVVLAFNPLVLGASGATPTSSGSGSAAGVVSSGGVFMGQSYSGVLIGNAIYENNTFPFQSYASSSYMLALPAIGSWLHTHGLSADDLRPYLTLYPSVGNPYDFAQGTAVENGTTYNIYEYIVTNSSIGKVIGAWVTQNNTQTSPIVSKIFTYDTEGSNIVNIGASSGAGVFQSSGVGPGVGPLNTGHNNNSFNGVGHQTEDTALSGSNVMYGAVYNTTVFSDLTSPSSCGSVCWAWTNWIGASNYSWISSTFPTYPYFFQAEMVYWGGNLGEPSNCGGTYTSNCQIFQYDLDNGQTLTTYAPGSGDWGSGDSVTLKWDYFTQNCVGSGYNQVNVVQEVIDDVSASTSVSYSACMPNITYSQFLEERPLVGSYLAQNPKFGTHDFVGALTNGNGDIPLNSGSNTWKITLVDQAKNNLVTCTTLNNGATSSSWSSSWVASTYP